MHCYYCVSHVITLHIELADQWSVTTSSSILLLCTVTTVSHIALDCQLLLVALVHCCALQQALGRAIQHLMSHIALDIGQRTMHNEQCTLNIAQCTLHTALNYHLPLALHWCAFGQTLHWTEDSSLRRRAILHSIAVSLPTIRG